MQIIFGRLGRAKAPTVSCWLSLERPAQETQKIAVGEVLRVCGGVAAGQEHLRDALKIGDGVHVSRGLLAAVGGVEIGAEANMTCVASDLADVINMIDKSFQTQT